MNSRLESRFHRLATGGYVLGRRFLDIGKLGLVGRLYRPNHQLPQFLLGTKPPHPAESLFLTIRQLRHPLDFQD
jgi:hypothetical protein